MEKQFVQSDDDKSVVFNYSPSHHSSLILENTEEKLEADHVQLLVAQVQPVVPRDVTQQIPEVGTI